MKKGTIQICLDFPDVTNAKGTKPEGLQKISRNPRQLHTGDGMPVPAASFAMGGGSGLMTQIGRQDSLSGVVGLVRDSGTLKF